MNTMSNQFTLPFEAAKKAEVFGILEAICQELEPTKTQLEAVTTSYNAVGKWLAESSNPMLAGSSIYAHGSTAVGTTVRPIGQNEFDADLIQHVLNFTADQSPAELKRIVGDRLREHTAYAAILVEKKRCWRLDYAGDYHLDISPTIANPACENGGELVPDKKLRQFKPTNPKGFKSLFERRAELMPRFRLAKTITDGVSPQASVEPFPTHSGNKGVLRRTVQLLKRHRDLHFLPVTDDIAPISIIITTLAARSYEFCVDHFTFESELDVLVATIRLMPHFIDRPIVSGQRIYVVENETTSGENFADRWNSEPQRAAAFYEWHAKALSDFEGLAGLEGMDKLTKSLNDSLGPSLVRGVIDKRTEEISAARTDKKLFVAPMVGLTTSAMASATPVKPNTFFGD
ncbi:nucleotidyltransferase domain-containing protein [Alteraurantiacibacter aquimixticola]|nr:nucleotidyltransferase [Alteraurantiacibacter aquimixticola]